ncbi:MAG: TRAP transporter permease, partial [Beijerinckiaceae bacterium]
FLGVKSYKSERRSTPPWYDWLAVAGILACGGFIILYYPQILDDLGLVNAPRVIFGLIAVFLVLEATRRSMGWALVIVALVFIFYALFSDYFPGVLNVPATRWDRLTTYLYLDSNSLFGLPMFVTASIIVGFILFGRLLYAVHGDEFLTDFAMAVMGKYRGGPAKVAVVASSLFGTTSGSAVSNVVMDGPITIPMMTRGGYRPETAAAIEAVASTGGQIMPPVMGITAFLIAEYLNLPYGDIVIAAAVPAMLYYLALFTQVDLEAGKLGLVGLPAASLPKLRNIMGRGWVFVVPIVVLLWTLVFENWSPGRASVTAAVLVVIIGFFHPATRPTFASLVDALAETGRTLIDLVVITAIAGIVIGVLQVSGLGSNFSLVLVTASGNSLFVLLLMTAGVCIVLGMGMPTGVIYMMLAVLVAPALKQFGVVDISAHLFIFYFGSLSMITPPVCMATFAAAAIARTDFWATGWEGVRLSVVAYIVPFVMIYQPALVMEGEWWRIILGVGTASIGVVVLSAGVAGYMYRTLTSIERIAFFFAGFLWIVTPARGEMGLYLHLAGAAVTAALLWWVRQSSGKRAIAAQ